MISRMLRTSYYLVPFLFCLIFGANVQGADQPTWLEQSNAIADHYSLAYGNLYPEEASLRGYFQFDPKGMVVSKDTRARDLAFFGGWEKRLTEELADTTNPELRLDLEILLNYIRQEMERIELANKYNEIPFLPISKFIYQSLEPLVIDEKFDRKASAVTRFFSYVPDQTAVETEAPAAKKSQKPFIQAVSERLAAALANAKKVQAKGGFVLFPHQDEVKKYLASSGQYIGAIKWCLEESGATGWEQAFETDFLPQIKAYDKLVAEAVLPNARPEPLPRDLYLNKLRTVGIEDSPAKLIALGKEAYEQTYPELEKLAAEIAAKFSADDLALAEKIAAEFNAIQTPDKPEIVLSPSDPAVVINVLKQKSPQTPEEIKALFRQAEQTLASISAKLVTLPEEPLIIKFLSLEDSWEYPFPTVPLPPLTLKPEERLPVLHIPTDPAAERDFDDFSNRALATTIMAHEGRPGHDLQFRMIDTSIIRGEYAANFANIEGWGMYAEYIVYDYLPTKEEKFGSRLMLLFRMARTYLDPQVQLGQVDKDTVITLYTKRLGLSETVANNEFNKYSFGELYDFGELGPGQAVSYYYGLIKMLKVRETVKKKMQQKGKPFSLKCFNDAVLVMGLLPYDELTDRLVSNLKCAAN